MAKGSQKPHTKSFIADSDEELAEGNSSASEAEFTDDASDSDAPKNKSKQKKKAPKPQSSDSKAKGKAKASEKPAKKRKAAESDEHEAESGEEKAKSDKPAKKAKGGLKKNAEGDYYAELPGKKRVTVRQFQGRTLIDIREYYEDKNTEEMKPGKKGIALSPEGWSILEEIMDDVNEEVARLANKS